MSFSIITLTDTGMAELEYTHLVSNSPANTIAQWYNAGGMISFYDYPLDVEVEVCSCVYASIHILVY